jgi:ketosteroid isomerase-like protein
VIVVEYELTGTVRDGKIAAWREYQDRAAIARALAQPPA